MVYFYHKEIHHSNYSLCLGFTDSIFFSNFVGFGPADRQLSRGTLHTRRRERERAAEADETSEVRFCCMLAAREERERERKRRRRRRRRRRRVLI